MKILQPKRFFHVCGFSICEKMDFAGRNVYQSRKIEYSEKFIFVNHKSLRLVLFFIKESVI